MDGPNLGFTLFLVLLLIAPDIPLVGFAADVSVSPAAAGLVVWLMLAPRLPYRVLLTMPTVLALIGFAAYVLLVSFNSGRPVSIAYGAQYAFYTLMTGLLFPAYVVQRTRQGRQGEVWRIVAWVGGVYLVGLIVSLWTGPFYPHQVGMIARHYESFDIVRGIGFAESANSAGAVAAVLAAGYIFVYRPSGRPSFLLALLAVAGLISTMSRGAILAFVAAILFLGVIASLRTLLGRGSVRLRIPLFPAALMAFAVLGAVASYQHPSVAAMWERLFLNEEAVLEDSDRRLQSWAGGLRRWAANPTVDQLTGAGFRSLGVSGERGIYSTSHNVYVEMLNDFGLAGVLAFVAILGIAGLRALYLVLLYPDNRLARFCLVGLATLVANNITQTVFLGMESLSLLVVLLTCGEIATRRADSWRQAPAVTNLPTRAAPATPPPQPHP